MRNVFIAAAAFAVLGTAGLAGSLSGEIETTIEQNANDNWGASTELSLGITASDLAKGSISFKAAPDSNITVDEYHVGTSIRGVELTFGDQGNNWIGAEGEHTLADPAMDHSLYVGVGGARVALGFSDVENDISDLSNVQGTYNTEVAGLDVTAAGDYNLDAENLTLGAEVHGLAVAGLDLGGAATYDMDAEHFAYEGVITGLGITGYVNGDQDDALQNIGAGYDYDLSGISLGADLNYNIDDEDWTPSITATFSF